MTISALEQMVEQHSQEVVASLLGTSQAAISLSLKNKRDIYVVRNRGSYSAFELRPVFNTNPDMTKIKKHIRGITDANDR